MPIATTPLSVTGMSKSHREPLPRRRGAIALGRVVAYTALPIRMKEPSVMEIHR